MMTSMQELQQGLINLTMNVNNFQTNICTTYDNLHMDMHDFHMNMCNSYDNLHIDMHDLHIDMETQF